MNPPDCMKADKLIASSDVLAVNNGNVRASGNNPPAPSARKITNSQGETCNKSKIRPINSDSPQPINRYFVFLLVPTKRGIIKLTGS